MHVFLLLAFPLLAYGIPALDLRLGVGTICLLRGGTLIMLGKIEGPEPRGGTVDLGARSEGGLVWSILEMLLSLELTYTRIWIGSRTSVRVIFIT